jgi:uncharacterized protein CbrC (UPF0167 family)
MVSRSLQEIQSDIQSHKDAIKALEKEVKDFQAACPHPENFQKVTRKSYDDEYGRLEGYGITTTCLLCGHTDYRTEDADRSYFR